LHNKITSYNKPLATDGNIKLVLVLDALLASNIRTFLIKKCIEIPPMIGNVMKYIAQAILGFGIKLIFEIICEGVST